MRASGMRVAGGRRSVPARHEPFTSEPPHTCGGWGPHHRAPRCTLRPHAPARPYRAPSRIVLRPRDHPAAGRRHPGRAHAGRLHDRSLLQRQRGLRARALARRLQRAGRRHEGGPARQGRRHRRPGAPARRRPAARRTEHRAGADRRLPALPRPREHRHPGPARRAAPGRHPARARRRPGRARRRARRPGRGRGLAARPHRLPRPRPAHRRGDRAQAHGAAAARPPPVGADPRGDLCRPAGDPRQHRPRVRVPADLPADEPRQQPARALVPAGVRGRDGRHHPDLDAARGGPGAAAHPAHRRARRGHRGRGRRRPHRARPGRGRPDELTDLARAFNRMVQEVAESRTRIEFLNRMGTWQEMARRLAHEIKNPLTPIQLAVQECHRRYDGSDARFRKLLDTTLEIVEEEVGTLRRLVTEFSSFARLPRASLMEGDLTEYLGEQRDHLALGESDDEAAGALGTVSVQWALPAHPLPVAFDAMLLGVALARQLTRRIDALAVATEGVAAGDLTVRAPVEGA
ncbi:MAG: hypothetical protein EOO75_19900, partial [Myxococcales bacterium]